MVNKHILVTGGAGFIGSHLCQNLLNHDNVVFCMDNFITGNYENISKMLSNPKFKLIECDVEQLCDFDAKIDEIYNLACPASPIHYQKDPIKTFTTSIQGAYNMLELSRKYDAKILQASTSEVYGDPIIHPQKENYWGNVNPVGIRACYDEGKRGAETMFMDFYRQHDVRIKIIRIFNTYGPNMHPCDGRVVSNFIMQALSNKDITIYGTGLQSRSFQYIDNLIEGMVKIMATGDDVIGPVNLGNPTEYTILDLAKSIIELTNSRSKLIFVSLPLDDPRRRKPDITLAHNLIGYNPNIELIEGLKKTIAYFQHFK
ncbi:MAG: UDP-glucuronic acid decarboxylase family protein [Muribaculaceae bacterium]